MIERHYPAATRVMRAIVPLRILPICLLFLVPTPPALPEVQRQTDAQTGLLRWTLREGPLRFDLVQRLPDQTRAFFLARGFPKAEADRLAEACVFQAIGRNTGTPGQAPAVHIDLGQWRVRAGGSEAPPLLKEQWLDDWGRSGAVSPPARLAFRWATFPSVQTFEPRGDYNWGMISFGPPPGASFDLEMVWHEGAQRRSAWIEGLQCPPEAAPRLEETRP